MMYWRKLNVVQIKHINTEAEKVQCVALSTATGATAERAQLS